MKKIRQEIATRRREHREAVTEEQKNHTHGRWVADGSGALRRPEIRNREKHSRTAPKQIARAALLSTEQPERHGLELDDGEVADRVSQLDIRGVVDMQTADKQFSLTLGQLGPYSIDFSRNGAHLALCGLRGHLSTVSWKKFDLVGETQLKDKCSDVKFLVDNSMLAVAQKKYTYMYTKEGVEMHVLPSFANVDRLEFLPHHQLLVGASSTYSVMQYLDVSTGKTVASKDPSNVRVPTSAIRKNAANGVVATGDLRGIVKLWSPTVADPLVQLKAHKGAVRDLAVHPNGRFFLSLGVDGRMKVWDCRTLRALDDYGVTYNFDTMDISDKGLVALGGGTAVHVWRDMFTAAKPRGPHIKHGLGYGNVACKVQFCPYEDILGIGHSNGFATMIVPGAGEASPDFYQANPYETETHRKGRVVGTLLDKLPPDTITIDLQIAGVDEKAIDEYNERLQASRSARSIREKKQRKADAAVAGEAPTGLPDAAVDDEVDEDLGVQERGPTQLWKSKAEKQKESKMRSWDKKDSSDKVRSKQKMRSNQLVKRAKWQTTQERILSQTSVAEEATEGGPGAADEKLRKAKKEKRQLAGTAAPAQVRKRDRGADPGAVGDDGGEHRVDKSVMRSSALRSLL